MNYDKLKNTELFLFDMDGTLYLGVPSMSKRNSSVFFSLS